MTTARTPVRRPLPASSADRPAPWWAPLAPRSAARASRASPSPSPSPAPASRLAGHAAAWPQASATCYASAPSEPGAARGAHAGDAPQADRHTDTMTNPHLLLIDDDSRLTRMVGDYLRGQGFDVDTAATLAEGRMRLHAGSYDALVLDLMLPDGDGLDFTRELRGVPSTRRLPLMMLTARGEPTDRIVGLELGADDYLPKPFEPRELLARLKALLRRATPEPDQEEVLRFGRLEIDLGAHEARLDGARCDLTSHQFDLLVVLARSPGRVLSRDQIMDALKGHPLEAFDRSIDVHISRIRAVIEDDPKSPKRVLTVRGSGYLFARKQDS